MSELIDRQQAIDAVMEYGAIWMEYTDAMSKDEIAQAALNNAKRTMIRILKEQPTVQPEPKTGKWTIGLDNRYMEKYYYCSCCGCRKYGEHKPLDDFCSNCGADMKRRTDG